MTRDEFLAKLLDQAKDIVECEPWISPDWAPFNACSEDEKEQFIHWINLITAFAPKTLGAIAVSFEKVAAEHHFLIYEPDLGDDKDFYLKRLKT